MEAAVDREPWGDSTPAFPCPLPGPWPDTAVDLATGLPPLPLALPVPLLLSLALALPWFVRCDRNKCMFTPALAVAVVTER